MIKVAIDSGPLTGGHSVRGVGAYTAYLVKHLRKIKGLNVETVDFKKTNLSNYDIVHYPYFHPFFITLPFFKKTKTIVTIHDLIPLIYPKHYPPGLKGRTRFLIQKQLIKKIDHIIAVSETTKKDIVRLLNIPPEKIKVVYEGYKKVYKPIEDGAKEKDEVIKKYKLPGKFVLYVGDVNYNKNIVRLADACKLAKISLVIAGKQAANENIDRNHPENREFVRFLDKYGSDPEIMRLGYVSDEDLKVIYNLATLYCQPSLYEGFGLPVLEAFACGAPVLISKTQALVEVVGDDILTMDPKSTKDMADKISMISKSPMTRAMLSKKGRERVKRYSWDKAAKETAQIYHGILER